MLVLVNKEVRDGCHVREQFLVKLRAQEEIAGSLDLGLHGLVDYLVRSGPFGRLTEDVRLHTVFHVYDDRNA